MKENTIKLNVAESFHPDYLVSKLKNLVQVMLFVHLRRTATNVERQ